MLDLVKCTLHVSNINEILKCNLITIVFYQEKLKLVNLILKKQLKIKQNNSQVLKVFLYGE